MKRKRIRTRIPEKPSKPRRKRSAPKQVASNSSSSQPDAKPLIQSSNPSTASGDSMQNFGYVFGFPSQNPAPAPLIQPGGSSKFYCN